MKQELIIAKEKEQHKLIFHNSEFHVFPCVIYY